MRILVTAATGMFGLPLVHKLNGGSVRALVRGHRPELPETVEQVVGDFDDADSLDAAMVDVDRLFLSSPSEPKMVARQTAVIDAAARAGSVKRLVKLSGLGAESPLDDVVVRWHHEIEQHVDACGFAEVVHLRPTMVMQNVLIGVVPGTAATDIGYPFGNHAVPEVDADDVAEVAARVLEARALPSRTVLELTGPEALTYHEIAEILSAESGTRFRYLAWKPEEFAAEAASIPPHVVAHSVELAALMTQGFGTRPSGHVELVLGRPARGHREFARRNAARLKAVEARK